MPLAWIALNSVKGLGPVRIGRLIEHYGSADTVCRQSAAELIRSGAMAESCARQLASKELFLEAEKQIKLAEALKARILTLASAEYPPYLKEIFAPPPVLYVRGDISVFSRHAVAVVGTRGPTVYGKSVAVSLTRELVENRLVIISGLALGIDAISHRTCLDMGEKTVAVLGCGVEQLYPRSNRDLGERIVEQGAVVSEFPIGTPPEPFNFPRRNRIISGLSAGVLVIEGGERSGGLITAHYALAQNRDVFAVPGPINSPLSMGPFNLIKEGAIPCRSGHELAKNLSLIAHPHLKAPPQGGLNIQVSKDLLSSPEKKIFDILDNQPKRLDEIAELAGENVSSLFNVLLNLELKGMVRQMSGQTYVRA